MLYTYNKLIRDNNVKLMENKGCKVTYEILDDKRYGQELDKKLQEEVSEYLADYSVEEMADVMEVIYAMLDFRGITMEEVEKVRLNKRNLKGVKIFTPLFFILFLFKTYGKSYTRYVLQLRQLIHRLYG